MRNACGVDAFFFGQVLKRIPAAWRRPVPSGCDRGRWRAAVFAKYGRESQFSVVVHETPGRPGRVRSRVSQSSSDGTFVKEDDGSTVSLFTGPNDPYAWMISRRRLGFVAAHHDIHSSCPPFVGNLGDHGIARFRLSRRQALHGAIVPEPFGHRLDHRLVLLFFFDLAERDQHDEERQQQRHHVAERDDPLGNPSRSFFFVTIRHGLGSLLAGPQFRWQERIELLFDHSRVLTRLNRHDPADNDLQAEHLLLVDKT